MKARPPHIRFVTRPVEDRNASIAAGHPVFTDRAHVILTPQGSKDSVEKVASEWLEASDTQVREERLPAEWAEKFHAAFDHWKRGEEIPVEGTALANWPVITPAELQSCKNVHILSLEELAVANDEAIRRLGMGGLSLKQRAIKYLAASAGPGKLIAENKSLQEKFIASEERRVSLEERVVALEALIKPNSPVKLTPAQVGIEEKL